MWALVLHLGNKACGALIVNRVLNALWSTPSRVSKRMGDLLVRGGLKRDGGKRETAYHEQRFDGPPKGRHRGARH